MSDKATSLSQWELQTLFVNRPGYGAEATKYEGQVVFANGFGEQMQFKVPPTAMQAILDIVADNVAGSSISIGARLKCGPLEAKGLPQLAAPIPAEDPAAKASGVEEKSLSPVDDLPF
jgi:hypothetical protein